MVNIRENYKFCVGVKGLKRKIFIPPLHVTVNIHHFHLQLSEQLLIISCSRLSLSISRGIQQITINFSLENYVPTVPHHKSKWNYNHLQ